MDYHADRTVVLSTESGFSGLYSWSLSEVDADGKKIGQDQVPWDWSLNFAARDLVYLDGLIIEPDDDSKDAAAKLSRRSQRIRALLEPYAGARANWREPSYSLFGSSRTLKAISLQIHRLEDSDAAEYCRASGCLSYTTEIDFRNSTQDDWVEFSLHVRPVTFAAFAAAIKENLVGEAMFTVGRVHGFYSGWSPSISTSHIKVLANLSDHGMNAPEGATFKVLRLGEVGEATFTLSSHVRFPLSPSSVSTDEAASEDPDGAADSAQPSAEIMALSRMEAVSGRTLAVVSSLKTAAWVAVVVLILTFLWHH